MIEANCEVELTDLELSKYLENESTKANTILDMAEKHFESGAYLEALELTKEIKDDLYDIDVYIRETFIKACSLHQLGNLKEARENVKKILHHVYDLPEAQEIIRTKNKKTNNRTSVFALELSIENENIESCLFLGTASINIHVLADNEKEALKLARKFFKSYSSITCTKAAKLHDAIPKIDKKGIIHASPFTVKNIGSEDIIL